MRKVHRTTALSSHFDRAPAWRDRGECASFNTASAGFVVRLANSKLTRVSSRVDRADAVIQACSPLSAKLSDLRKLFAVIRV